MPAGETEKSPSPWTVDSLKEHIADSITALWQRVHDRFTAHETLHNERFSAQEKAIKLAVDAVENESAEREKAIDKSESNMKERLVGLESVVDRLANQVNVLMPRAEAEQRIGQNTDKIASVDEHHQTDIAAINSRLDINTGSSTGADKYRATLIAIAAIALAIISFVMNLSSP